ncbi:hypothetical protein [Actinomadura bangladeshensis]|uniref:Uncharacterized protein n=1 Tax=Actinomadura bangladeshensis TaxID=453573 RepID=A0A4R4NYF6_9ACTN|nr:hypothetical protein [Actinomadura bangladeshensis]TDC12542.1 hypothetical protein E1284_23025 [Actinomadura bangladeshensis]
MPARRSVADTAALLLTDAEAVERATERLRALTRRLQDDPATPSWFAAAASAHITAAAVAAADLSQAATRLRALSESAARTTAPPSRASGG